MGTMNHNAVIATTWSDKHSEAFSQWLITEDIDDWRYVIIDEVTNGYRTFFLPPDGSKEGWEASDNGDSIRNKIVQRLASDNYDDNSSPWDWVEVGFGEYGQTILRGNCTNVYNDKEYAGDRFEWDDKTQSYVNDDGIITDIH